MTNPIDQNFAKVTVYDGSAPPARLQMRRVSALVMTHLGLAAALIAPFVAAAPFADPNLNGKTRLLTDDRRRNSRSHKRPSQQRSL